MAEKPGAGGKLQKYDTSDGQYEKEDGGESADSNKGYDSRDDFRQIIDRVNRVRSRNSGDNDSSWNNGLPPRGHVDIPPGVDKADYVADELGISKEIAERFVAAIDAYSDNRYTEIRAYQQGKPVKDTEDIAQISEDLENYIKAAPRWNAGETFRGIGLSDKDLVLYKKGSVHDMQGVSSWSNEPAIANDFADEYRINRHMNNAVIFHSQTQNKGTATRHLSQYPGPNGENEVLVSKDSRYRVTDKKTDNKGRIHIYLEEL